MSHSITFNHINMYTPIIAPADLNNVLYPEIQDEITRGNSTVATEAIDTAVQEAKMYLTRYDLTQLFGDPTPTDANPNGIAATFSDTYLTRMIKDIATWHLLQLANPNMNYESAKGRYEEALNTLKRIQKGTADPQWPFQDKTGETAPLSDSVVSLQQTKRNNNF